MTQIPQALRALKQAHDHASAAYMAHKALPVDAAIDERIAHDIVGHRLLKMTTKTRLEYEDALAKHATGQELDA